MRRVLFLSLPILLLLCAGLGWYVVANRGDLVADARLRLARGDLHGAQIDLDSFLRRNPGNAEAEFRLGQVLLALDNPVAAARELRLARDHGYSARAIILPLGQTYIRQQLYDQALENFDPDRAPPGGQADTLALRAQLYLALHRMDEAAAAALAAKQAGPNDIAPCIAAARVALARGDLASAEAESQRALRLDPGSADALKLAADIALHRGKPQEALTLAQQVLAANPADNEAKMAAARAYAALGRSDQAIPLLNQVARAEHRDSAPRFLRAVLADKAHDFATADTNLNAISSVIDDLPQGQYYLGVTKLGLGQVDQAQEAAAKYHARSPSDPQGTKLLALTELALHRPDQAAQLIAGLVAGGHADAETLDLLGRAQSLAGNYAAAAASFARAVALSPGDVDILNRLAATKLQLGQDEAAVDDLKHSLALKPGQDDAGTTLVHAALAHGDVKVAAEAVASLRQAHGETPVVGMLNAAVLAAGQDLRGAETAYRAVLARYPETPANQAALRQTTLGLVQTLAQLGDVPGLQAVLTGWVQQHPKDVEALGLLVKLLLADGKPDQAVTVASAAHDASPADIGLTELLARTYVAAHKLDRAESLLDRAGAGTNPTLGRQRAEVLAMAGKSEEARTAYANLLQLAPGDVVARLGLVQLDVHAKDYDAARRRLREGLALRPGDASLMQSLVAVDVKDGGIQAGLATADALAADPQNLPAARLLRVSAYEAAGDKPRTAEAALAAYRAAPSTELALVAWRALTAAGRRPEGEALMAAWAAAHPDDATAAQVLGAVTLAEHKTGEAARYLNTVLAQRPNDPVALNNMAWVMLAHGDLAQARRDAQRAYFIRPDAETADSLGWILQEQGDTDHALPLLRQAVSTQATPSLAYHYAVALDAAGQHSQARELLRRILADPQAFDERDDARRKLDALSK
jgi:putative PEP-CTERM system TPR-repeat lipoprotein